MNYKDFLPLDGHKRIHRFASHLWKTCDIIDDELIADILRNIPKPKYKDLFRRCIKKAPGRQKYLFLKRNNLYKKPVTSGTPKSPSERFREIGEKHKDAAKAIDNYSRPQTSVTITPHVKYYSQTSPASPRPTNGRLEERKLARKEEILRRIEEDRLRRGVKVKCNTDDEPSNRIISYDEMQKAASMKETVVVKKARKLGIAEAVDGSGKLRIHNSKRQFVKIIPSGNLTHK